MALTLQSVQTRGDLKCFVTFPWRVYRGDPNWVPPLISEQLRKLDTTRNPFWRTAERELWLATRDGRPVGTIAAIIDHVHNRALGEQVGTFGFFECVDDQAVADALLDQAATWLRARGMAVLRGPFNPSGSDEVGVLIEGHDTRPALLEAHTPPYYVRLLEGAGLRKYRDTMAWLVSAPPEAHRAVEVLPARLVRVADWARSRAGVRLRPVDMARWDEEVDLACRIYNGSLSTLPDFVPLSQAEFRAFAGSFKPFLDPKAALVAEVDGEPAGFALALPDLNEALRHANGRLWPFGALKVWWHSRRITRATFKILMILPQHRARGLEALMVLEMANALLARGYREADLSLTGEENENIQRLLGGLGLSVYRRYRIYEREVS